ncbi:hypothetical protein K438DRAFT_1752429 [Mycena galopus ATCC 62051]|nr:hypothetical protein K438DRAFT_1752429 [Mycena galopus ATCC 62051]
MSGATTVRVERSEMRFECVSEPERALQATQRGDGCGATVRAEHEGEAMRTIRWGRCDEGDATSTEKGENKNKIKIKKSDEFDVIKQKTSTTPQEINTATSAVALGDKTSTTSRDNTGDERGVSGGRGDSVSCARVEDTKKARRGANREPLEAVPQNGPCNKELHNTTRLAMRCYKEHGATKGAIDTNTRQGAEERAKIMQEPSKAWESPIARGKRERNEARHGSETQTDAFVVSAFSVRYGIVHTTHNSVGQLGKDNKGRVDVEVAGTSPGVRNNVVQRRKNVTISFETSSSVASDACALSDVADVHPGVLGYDVLWRSPSPAGQLAEAVDNDRVGGRCVGVWRNRSLGNSSKKEAVEEGRSWRYQRLRSRRRSVASKAKGTDPYSSQARLSELPTRMQGRTVGSEFVPRSSSSLMHRKLRAEMARSQMCFDAYQQDRTSAPEVRINGQSASFANSGDLRSWANKYRVVLMDAEFLQQKWSNYHFAQMSGRRVILEEDSPITVQLPRHWAYRRFGPAFGMQYNSENLQPSQHTLIFSRDPLGRFNIMDRLFARSWPRGKNALTAARHVDAELEGVCWVTDDPMRDVIGGCE